MSIVVIPDSFKGSMTSHEVTEIISTELKQYTNEKVIELPIADGGEGSTDCILEIKKGRKKIIKVHSADQRMIDASYGIIDDSTAVIEIAESSGLTKQNGLHPLTSNTYGFGELILDALNEGCRTFYLCLGGSATTDCGTGMASALGVKFYDENHQSFIPTGESLCHVSKIDKSTVDQRVLYSTFTILTDVTNPLYGKQGAAYIYGPQKGATSNDILLLDKGLEHIAKIIQRDCYCCTKIKGAGAAGGAGLGCVAFLNGHITSGIEGFLELVHFDDYMRDCHLIITGEGCLDEQSLMGKVVSGIKAHSHNNKIIVFCGICKLTKEILEENRIEAIEIGKGIDIQESIQNGKYYLQTAVKDYIKSNLSRLLSD